MAYTVGNGDTLSTIAHKFGITLNTLLWANKLTVRSVIKPGNTLNILPVSGVEHTIKGGDTVTAIAKKYGVNATDILAYNKLPSGSGLTVGVKLIVPGGEFKAPTPVAAVRNVAVKDIFTGVPSSVGTSGNKPTAGKMLWPTDLKYVVRGLSWTHTGLDVDCNGHANGTSTNTNYAAADGIVQFSGAKRGYGNTVEINHGNGIVTRYGHFYQLYVKAGEQITMGTPLGRCGSTGNSTGTHLHFEVIVNGKFKNPLDYLR
jgi:murein DD-endopeptidase MepM/ murein hydrolase activator NlpD